MYIHRIFLNYSRLNKFAVHHHKRCFSKTSNLYSFFENDDKGGTEYRVYLDQSPEEFLKDSRKAFVRECKKLWEETKERFQQDPKIFNHGDTDVFWRFDSEDCLKQWIVSSDKTNKEGQSECNLIINDKKKAVFYGNVDLTPPKDGKKRFAGYCGMKAVKKLKSFFRDDSYPFDQFTHLEMRVKGDGRNYAVHLGVLRYYDVNWYEMYTYALYTHGGPYWQVVRIPFSKFFLTSKGRIQDGQCPAPLGKINCIGIVCAGVAGPFRLEIDYIGCHVDFRHKEKFAYELYNIPKEFVST